MSNAIAGKQQSGCPSSKSAAPLLIKTLDVLQRYNFFRTPDWRWKRLQAIIQGRNGRTGRCSRRDDLFIKEARSFVLRWQSGNELKRHELAFENPGFYYAYEFHLRTIEDPENALCLEARLLARQTPEQIALVMGTIPEMVQWFADLYFDVIPYLDQRDWITKHVLMPALKRSTRTSPVKMGTPGDARIDNCLAKPFLDGSLKMLAYFGGPFVVDALIAGFEYGNMPTSREAVQGWTDSAIAKTIKRRLLQVSNYFEINQNNVPELFNAYVKLRALEQSDYASGKSLNEYEQHVQATLNAIPWTFGTAGEEAYANTIVGRFDCMAPELRDDELMLLASGRTVPQLADNFPKELPPPRKARKSILLKELDGSKAAEKTMLPEDS